MITTVITNKNCMWWPCWLTNWDEMSNLYRGPSKFQFIWESGFRGEYFLIYDMVLVFMCIAAFIYIFLHTRLKLSVY